MFQRLLRGSSEVHYSIKLGALSLALVGALSSEAFAEYSTPQRHPVERPSSTLSLKDCYWRLGNPSLLNYGNFARSNNCNEGDVMIEHGFHTQGGFIDDEVLISGQSFSGSSNHSLPDGITVRGKVKGGIGQSGVTAEIDLLCCPLR